MIQSIFPIDCSITQNEYRKYLGYAPINGLDKSLEPKQINDNQNNQDSDSNQI